MKNLTNKSLEFSDLKKLLLKKNLLSFNRKINKAHVRDMANSIMNCGLLRDPIIGDVSSFDHRRKYVIIDGQNLAQAIINLGYNNKQPIQCKIKVYENKAQLIYDISTLNTVQKRWTDTDFLLAWFNYGKDNLEHWTNYAYLHRQKYDIFPKLSLGNIISIYTNKKRAFKQGKLKFFNREFSDKLVQTAYLLKDKYNKPAHTISGLIYWAIPNKENVDFIKLNSRIKTALRNNEDKYCNGRDDFKEFINKIYTRV